MLITDRDPILAAKATPVELIPTIAKAINEGYKKAQVQGYIQNNKISPLADLVHNDLTYSRKNCEWYIEFYKELRDIARVSTIIDIPDIYISTTLIVQGIAFMANPLNLHNPLMDEYYYDLFKANRPLYENAPDIYTISRLLLVDMKPEFVDFVKGVPHWLVKMNEELICTYDPSTRRHIKITIEDNKLHYYTSIISDNWKEIKDVPREMDCVVRYLISNRPNLALTDES